MPRSQKELRDALGTQRRHMAASCAAYDAGDHSEAVRLATCICNLVHDARKTYRSIMGQLGIKDTHTFFGTNIPDGAAVPAIALRYTPLVELDRLYLPPRVVPLVTYYKNRNAYFGVRDLSFDEWWDKDIIFLDGPHRLTRRQLVLTLRDQEGGSHYDAEVRNTNFGPLKQPVFMFIPGKGLGRMKDLELATMRQVAEELELSFAVHEKDRHPHLTHFKIEELEKQLRKEGTR
jgi:hypothetical protein